MSASPGALAAKLLVKTKDISEAVPVRYKAEAPEMPDEEPSGYGDFGADPVEGEGGSGTTTPSEVPTGYEPVPGSDSFPVFAMAETAAEQVRAGKDTDSTTYVLWCMLEDGVPPASTDVWLAIEGVGVVNVTGVVPRPTENLCRLDAEVRGT